MAPYLWIPPLAKKNFIRLDTFSPSTNAKTTTAMWITILSIRSLFITCCKMRQVLVFASVFAMSIHANLPKGREIMSTYRSAHKALLVAYPDVALKPWKFRKPFKAWWDAVYANFHSGDPLVEAVVREYMDELYDEIVITSTPEVSSTPEKEHDKSRIAILSAWATVTNKQLGSTASRHIAKLGGIYVLLRRLYPPSEDAETSEIENQLWNKLRHRKFARFARRKQIIQKQLLNNVARVL